MPIDDEMRSRIARESAEAAAAAVAVSGELAAGGSHRNVIAIKDRRPSDSTPDVAIMRCASDIEPRELEPLWPGMLWIGKPTLLTGDPGLGKSLVTADIAARVSSGAPWPCSTEAREPGTVLMLSAEDDPEDTGVPRLLAAGAERERIHFLEAISTQDSNGAGRECPVSLDAHMGAIRSAILSLGGNVKLVVIDPISAFLGATDSHNNAEIRTLLAALGRLATELRFSVLVVSHLNKANSSKSIYRVTGSLAFVAAARAVFAVVRDPDESGLRLVLPIKSNLGPDTHGYRYNVNVSDNGVPYIAWDDERETRTADQVLASDSTPRDEGVTEKINSARDWLAAKLSDGPQLASDMERAAKLAGISDRSLRSAKKSLRMSSKQQGFKGPWLWSLPDHGRTP
jgi:putative DNA primase/helicase